MNKLSLVLVLLLAILGLPLKSDTVGSPQVKARLLDFNGSIQLKMSGSMPWKSAIRGMSLESGDVIQVGEASWADIFLANGSIIRAAAGSTVEISKLDFDRKSNAMKLDLKINPLGRIIAAIRKIQKDGNQVGIYTPVTVVGVRGTDLVVDVPNADTTVTGVWDGKVVVKDFVSESGLSTDNNTMMLDFIHEINVAKDEFSQYRKGSGFTKSKDIAKSYETDKALLPELKDKAAKMLVSDSTEEQSKARALREEALKQE